VDELPFSPIHEHEQDQAVATLVSAFTDDPVERWLYPELSEYLEYFPAFVAAFGGKALEQRTSWRLGEFSAVALWFGPGTGPDDEAIATVLAESVSAAKHADMFAVLDQMGVAHPRYPHWYLPWFGVDRSLQGQGVGRQLMERCLTIVDVSGLPVYLETPNPRTVAFYERHGFAVAGHSQAGSCPAVTSMLRPAP
jgi:GNAT superfamily N-acetyltransferase